jgi:hypothetical protein
MTMISADPALLTRIRNEFLEMPGLCLTGEQARRLWNLDRSMCEAVLAALVREGFLVQSRLAFLRNGAGPYRIPGAA